MNIQFVNSHRLTSKRFLIYFEQMSKERYYQLATLDSEVITQLSAKEFNHRLNRLTEKFTNINNRSICVYFIER